MFDIGFAELLTIGVVALLVLGPERLPGAVRSTALVLGRLKRQAGEIKREIEREIDADGIRRDLRNENILADLERDRKDLEQGFEATRRDLRNLSAGTGDAASDAIANGDAQADAAPSNNIASPVAGDKPAP